MRKIQMKLIIDTDPGVDDAMAIIYAALAPDIELLGLTTVFGNVNIEQATRNALWLLEFIGQDAAVAKGAAMTLEGKTIAPSYNVHGDEGFGEYPAQKPKHSALEETAAEFLCRMAREHKGELVVCPIGPITNIAHAIQLDPEFATNVKKIVFMGGAAKVPGNITPHAEANTYHDPHALNIVINSGANVTMVGLDVTMLEPCQEEFFDNLAEVSPKFGGFLQEISRFYLKFYESIGVQGCGFHDPAAVIACTHPELFSTEQLPINVIEEGEEFGQTQICLEDEAPKISVCIDADMAQVKAVYNRAFGVDA